MANEIRDLFNRIPKVKNDFKHDWKEDLKIAAQGGVPKADFGTDAATVPTNSVAPVISGYTTNPAVGNTLTVGAGGTWTQSPTLSYAWKQTAGTGASSTILSTTNTYVVPSGAAGRQWTCTVTGVNSSGRISVTTAATPVSV